MEWFKHIIVDLFALIIIILAVFTDQIVLTYVVYTYTALMVLARLFSLLSGNLRAISNKSVSEAPLWVYHGLYAMSVTILLFGQWYITALGWLFIWIAAVYSFQKLK